MFIKVLCCLKWKRVQLGKYAIKILTLLRLPESDVSSRAYQIDLSVDHKLCMQIAKSCACDKVVFLVFHKTSIMLTTELPYLGMNNICYYAIQMPTLF